MKSLLIVVIALALALALVACGSNGRHNALGGNSIPQASAPDTSVQVAEVLATPAPEGVDEALWNMLRDELVRELGERQASQTADEELPEWGQNYFSCQSCYVEGSRRVTWNNTFFRGDGSQDGIVNVADLVPLAMHFGEATQTIPAAGVADYNQDGAVGITDVSVLAMNFGKTCSNFKVEISVVSRRTDYSTSTTFSFEEWAETRADGFADYSYDFSPGIVPVAWVRVTALNTAGEAIAYDTCVLAYNEPGPGGSYRPPYFPVENLTVHNSQEGTITWSSSFFEGDGTGDERVDTVDVDPIAMHFSQTTTVTPEATCADYDRNGTVNFLDLDCLWDHLYEICSGFVVEVSTMSATNGFTVGGYPTFWDIANTERNEFGFRVFEYTIQSPPVAPSYWVRITPYYEDQNTNRFLGLPSDAVEITP
jgi:hypothetical protein